MNIVVGFLLKKREESIHLTIKQAEKLRNALDEFIKSN